VIRNIQVFILLFFFGKKEACCMHKLSFRWQSAPSRHIAAQLTACNRAGTLQMSWQVDVVAAEPKVVRMVQEKLMIGHSYNGSSIILNWTHTKLQRLHDIFQGYWQKRLLALFDQAEAVVMFRANVDV